MPSRVPTVRYTEARHLSMRTSLSSAGVSSLMGYPRVLRSSVIFHKFSGFSFVYFELKLSKTIR